MSYIGNNLQVAYPTYKNIDDISGSFNGSTTSFPLTVGGVAPVPAPLSSNQCLISVDGVVQRPDDTGTEGFRLSGGNIIFSAAPAGGVDFFGVILAGADYVNVGVNFPSGSVSTPSITFDGDLDTGLYNPGANQLGFTTAGVNRLTIDASGNINLDSNTLYVDAVNNGVGIGTTSPSNTLHVEYSSATLMGLRIRNTDTTATAINGIDLSVSNGSAGAYFYVDSAVSGGSPYNVHIKRGQANASICFDNSAGTEHARIDSSGRLLVGTSTSTSNSKLQVQGNASVANGTGVVELQLGSASPASGTTIGSIRFKDTTADTWYGYILCEADGATGATDKPGRLVFSTTADGVSSPTERMRIDSSGTTLISKIASAIGTAGTEIGDGAIWTTRDANTAIRVNRLTSDGTLVEFLQASVAEGTISVSGTTVSYNGAHLSRWSQLPSGQKRTEILRGSVLSNIDEMCEWGDEENEQLNRMKVSDIEGDKNVSGVFQAWDDDDDTYTNDFYCAMTGDFIIRIAAGVAVERGDLLMSAGDGTAKPQDDDIIRSKTIAKVTSNNVSCTYADGSYCVPCVLMAC